MLGLLKFDLARTHWVGCSRG